MLVLRAKPGRRREVVALFERLRVLETASAVTGFLDSQLQLACDGSDELLVTATWESSEAYGRWLESPARERIGPELERLLVGPPAPRVYEIVHVVP